MGAEFGGAICSTLEIIALAINTPSRFRVTCAEPNALRSREAIASYFTRAAEKLNRRKREEGILIVFWFCCKKRAVYSKDW
jgi:hypothetical protein